MASYWQFGDGGLASGNVSGAPTYNDVFTKFAGQDYMTGYDPALAMTLNAGNQGGLQSGVGAFLSGRNAFQGTNEGGSLYDDSEMNQLAKQMNIDTKGLSGIELQGELDKNLGDYYQIGGMSAGWNPTGDARQGNTTLYKRQDGKLVPIQTQGGHLREQGNYVQEHPGVLAPFAVLGAGLAAGALGAGAAGGGGAAASGGGAAAGGGITGTAGASAAGAYGAMPAAWGGFAGSTGLGATGLGAGYGAGLGVYGGLGAGYLGGTALGAGGGGGSMFGQAADWYNSLPKYQQGALRGGAQSGLQSGGDPRAMARGALTGGLSAGVSDYLGGGALGNLGGRAAGMLGNMGMNALMGGPTGAGMAGGGGSGGAGGAGGGSGGGSATSGSIAGSVSGGGVAGGLSGGWRRPSAAIAADQAWQNQTYAPIAQEEARRKLAEKLADEADFTNV